MGMYTEIVAGFSLRPDAPEEVVRALHIICGDEFSEGPLPEHELFTKSRWKLFGRCSSYSFGFSSSHSTIQRDSLDRQWIVAIRADIKNYDREIEAFFDWIRPYVESGSGSRDLIGWGDWRQKGRFR